MEPIEVEFLAEKELVFILPNFRLERLYLISGDVGPLQPNIQIEVPLWLAMHLKQRQKCRLQPPSWMQVDELEKLKRTEAEADTFQPPPSPFYREIMQAFLSCAADDVPDADAVQALVQDLWDLRSAKLRRSIATMVREQATRAALNNMTLMEINACRPFLKEALDQLHSLRVQYQQLAAERGMD
ncbi:DNA replication complex GINS protein PSF2-like [Sycon ciliatum]|uniref:DNA replication complex GINS protein PSF2-like n=1 Tax=Sycon ciliatum TaxID=27933 RepID=UPI0031F65B1D